MRIPAPIRPAALLTLRVLSFGHCCAELNSSATSSLLPFLVAERQHTYAAVDIFVPAASIGGALLQPLIGHYRARTDALRYPPWCRRSSSAAFGYILSLGPIPVGQQRVERRWLS